MQLVVLEIPQLVKFWGSFLDIEDSPSHAKARPKHLYFVRLNRWQPVMGRCVWKEDVPVVNV